MYPRWPNHEAGEIETGPRFRVDSERSESRPERAIGN
jgi:hypothetical protein